MRATSGKDGKTRRTAAPDRNSTGPAGTATTPPRRVKRTDRTDQPLVDLGRWPIRLRSHPATAPRRLQGVPANVARCLIPLVAARSGNSLTFRQIARRSQVDPKLA